MPLAPRTQKPLISSDLSGAAGVFWVCMHLSLRGLGAIPTSRNAKAIDVLVSTAAGTASASLQVKTAQARDSSWPVSDPSKMVATENLFFAFVRWVPAKGDFEAFLVPSDRVKDDAQGLADAKASRGSKPFPGWRLPSSPTDREELKNAWESWSPDGSPVGILLPIKRPQN